MDRMIRFALFSDLKKKLVAMTSSIIECKCLSIYSRLYFICLDAYILELTLNI